MQSLTIQTNKSALKKKNYEFQKYEYKAISPCKINRLQEDKSPVPPISPMTPASALIQKDCPVCLNFMTEPCIMPDNPCEHRMCRGCIIQMFKQGGSDVFKFDKKMKKVCVKCPICRAYSFGDLNDPNFENEILLDVEHQQALKIAFNYEFKANLDPDYLEEMDHHQQDEYSECISRLSENCPLRFEIGIRDLKSTKGVPIWQSYVKLLNPEYQNIIDKILYRVDFCINESNLNGIKNPLVHLTDDYLFRSQKREFISQKLAPEITMEPMGTSKGGSSKCLLTQKPEYLPVKFYFNEIEGICCTEREVVHDDLLSGKNNKQEFMVIASKAHLDQLLKDDD